MRRLITQKNFQGLRLVSALDLPSGRGPFPAVIICHGFKGNKDSVWLKEIAKSLAKREIAALNIDFPNNPKPNQSGGKFLNLTFGQEMRDLRQMYAWLKRHPKVDARRIGLVGHSLGGKLVLHFASQHRLAAVVSLAAVVDDLHYQKMLKYLKSEAGSTVSPRGYVMLEIRYGRRLPLSLNFYRNVARWKTRLQIARISAPTLLLHGTSDKRVPLADARLAYRLLKAPKKITALKGFPHSWREPGQYRRVAKLTTDWFVQHLL